MQRCIKNRLFLLWPALLTSDVHQGISKLSISAPIVFCITEDSTTPYHKKIGLEKKIDYKKITTLDD